MNIFKIFGEIFIHSCFGRGFGFWEVKGNKIVEIYEHKENPS